MTQDTKRHTEPRNTTVTAFGRGHCEALNAKGELCGSMNHNIVGNQIVSEDGTVITVCPIHMKSFTKNGDWRGVTATEDAISHAIMQLTAALRFTMKNGGDLDGQAGVAMSMSNRYLGSHMEEATTAAHAMLNGQLNPKGN